VTAPVEAPADPRKILGALSALRTLSGTYPAGHPMIAERLREADEAVQQALHDRDTAQIDIVHRVVHLNGIPVDGDSDIRGIGVDSIHIRRGVKPEELLALAEVLWQLKPGEVAEPVGASLTRREVRHITVGRLVPLDTSWRAQQWADRPAGALDPDYEESLALAQQAFDDLSAGRPLDTTTIHDLVRLLISRVASSNAALAQILAVKQYENLTYCHSVNVAVLSLLLGRQLSLDDQTLTALVEAALLHDVGKTRVPLDLVKKPGALDRRERAMVEMHTTFGAEILVQVEGLGPLTPLVALEHHRTVRGGGYPSLGDGVVPHVFSQIVSVADIYEAVTGARTYQAPMPPERACLLLARLAGEKLNGALVKAFVNAITFFPIGSLVRTSRNEIGLVIGTAAGEPLHPVISLIDETLQTPAGDIDTSERDAAGAYCRHIVETLPRSDSLNVAAFLPSAA
jgi:putative nucleotidyltransferase with HDIG domain